MRVAVKCGYAEEICLTMNAGGMSCFRRVRRYRARSKKRKVPGCEKRGGACCPLAALNRHRPRFLRNWQSPDALVTVQAPKQKSPMILTPDQITELNNAAKPLILFLRRRPRGSACYTLAVTVVQP